MSNLLTKQEIATAGKDELIRHMVWLDPGINQWKCASLNVSQLRLLAYESRQPSLYGPRTSWDQLWEIRREGQWDHPRGDLVHYHEVG